MKNKTRLKKKLKKVRAMAKKLKVKLTYKKNGTYKYKSLKRLLNDIKKKRHKRCVRCNKCTCNRRNRFGTFDWNEDWKNMPPVSAAKMASQSHSARIFFWNENTESEKKKIWIQRLAKEATEKEWGGSAPRDRKTELAKQYDKLYLKNYKRIEDEMKTASPFNAPAASYKNIGIKEDEFFGKKTNRFG